MKKAVLFLLCSLLLLFVGNLLFGSVSIPAAEVWTIITGGEAEKESWRFIILESRLPQAITAILCGASLASSASRTEPPSVLPSSCSLPAARWQAQAATSP